MPLLLPIDARSADDSARAHRSSSLVSESETSSFSDNESSNSDGRKLSVKNTFIDVEAFESDEQQELPMHQRGARTCTARLSQIGRFPGAEDGELSTEASDTEFNEMEDTCSDAFMVEATPEAQSMRQFLASEAFSMSLIEAREPEPRTTIPCPAPAQACEVSEAPSQARRVMLQVPLEVEAASQAGSGDMQVAVVNSTSESLGSSTIIDMRIVVGPSGELQVLQSPAGQVLLSAALGSLAVGKTSSGTESSESAASVPASLAPESAAPADGAPREVPLLLAQRRETRAKTSPAGSKSSMVCCHWKNKGWCRYQENCRFMHPEHKRGVGLNNGKGAVVAGTPSSSSPGGVSVGGRFHPQQTGSGGRHVGPSARTDGFPFNMWTMPCDWAGFPSFVQQV